VEEERKDLTGDFTCAGCGVPLREDEVVKNRESVYCKECWNKKILKERRILPLYAFFVVFFLFQLFFYMPAFIHETRGFSSPLHLALCGIIGTLCGAIAFEEVYARLTRKLVKTDEEFLNHFPNTNNH
jgi:DNA-directed RNA polymerase subunit RPC12/RpoP